MNWPSCKTPDMLGRYSRGQAAGLGLRPGYANSKAIESGAEVGKGKKMELSSDLIVGFSLGIITSVIGNIVTPFVHKMRKYVNKYLIILLVLNALFVLTMVPDHRLSIFILLSVLPILDVHIRDALYRYFCRHGYPKGLGWISIFIAPRYMPAGGHHPRPRRKWHRIFPM